MIKYLLLVILIGLVLYKKIYKIYLEQKEIQQFKKYKKELKKDVFILHDRED